MTTSLNGLVGGAVVGVLATLAAHAVGGREATETASRWRAYLVPVAYGSAAGGLLVALELFVLGILAVPPSRGEALTVAVAWSIALLVAALAVRRFARETRFGRLQPRKLLVYHWCPESDSESGFG
ncbi:hypothetical protein SAMN04488063_2640 [Halopelagius inordinatus]|uniref:Uncharacterized protein n=1 Tax=Halopelagius inordinatus TaxID=553467 RepID=A0A1I2TCX3_9EURY|nr:hypothetical protein [Halopelagius inordinatus]SFG62864.1 hypothetical protein SAMN04488063_2640 [Halopelagius inordinatus]